MHPTFRILCFSVHAYGLMISLGAASGYAVFYFLLTSKYPKASKYLLTSILYSFVIGMIGARLTYIAVNEPKTLLHHDLAKIFLRWDGLSIHGAILWVFLFAFAYQKWAESREGKGNLPTIWEVGDAAAVAVPLGVFFGRLGCWFNGCCWGRYYPHGVVFPQLSGINPIVYHAVLEYPRYPVQLYASLFNLGVFLLALLLYFSGWYPRGELFALFILLYSYGRVVWDYLRWDETAVVLWHGRLTVAQLASIFAIAFIGTVIWVKRALERRGNGNASRAV